MNYDFETAIEDAFVNLLTDHTEAKCIRWDDNENKILSDPDSIVDVIKVKATSAEEESGTINTYAGIRMMVDIAAFASKRRDLASRNVNIARGKIRSLMSLTNIVDLLNDVGDIVVYPSGVIPVGAFEASDEKNYGKGITLQVVVYPKQ